MKKRNKKFQKKSSNSLSKLSLEFVRNYFSLVSQDVVLFDETLKYNICYGSKSVTQDKLEKICYKSSKSQAFQRCN